MVRTSGSERGPDHLHNRIDWVDRLRTDPADPVGQSRRRQIEIVDLTELRGRERPRSTQAAVNGLIEVRVVPGRLGVEDLTVSRDRGEAESLDLSKGDLSERHRALVFLAARRHRPLHGPACRGPFRVRTDAMAEP